MQKPHNVSQYCNELKRIRVSFSSLDIHFADKDILDFIYKNDKGRIKVFQIPYSFRDKSNLQVFKIEKSNLSNYTDLHRYIKFIDDFDCDMFTNSIIPSVLSKRYSIISMQPGAGMINLISKTLINDK